MASETTLTIEKQRAKFFSNQLKVISSKSMKKLLFSFYSFYCV